MDANKTNQFKNDLFGGITTGIVALPLALAFGVQSGLGAIYGLYGAMLLGMVAAVFGGTQTQVSGPTGPMTVITALVVMTAIEKGGSLELGMGIIIASFMLAGVFLILFGLLKIGKIIRYMPYPVVSGFMSGIGVLIILLQISPLFGTSAEKSAIDVVLHFNKTIASMNTAAFGIGLLTILIIYLLPKVTNKIPSILVALLVSTIIASTMHLDIPTIGNIPIGLPVLKLGALADVSYTHMWLIIEFAGMLAALCAIDSLLTSVVADNMTKTRHNSNQELIGQGIGNFVSGMFCGLPGAGATMRTVTNIKTGGTTKLSGFIHGIFLFAVLIGLGQYVAYIPLSVLAGILFKVGVDIIDLKGFKHLSKVPRPDALVSLIVLFITVFGNLINAVGIGLVLACVLFMKQASDLAERKTFIRELSSEYVEQDLLIKKVAGQVFIKELHGPLFFGISTSFLEMIESLDKSLTVLILQMGKVPSIDQSGLYALENAILDLYKKGVLVLLCQVQEQPMDMLKRINIVPELIPEAHIFNTISDCEQYLFSHLQEHDDFNQLKIKLKIIGSC